MQLYLVNVPPYFVSKIVPYSFTFSPLFTDWRGGSNKCLNDYDNAPMYIKIFGTYFESSKDACCQRYYSWDYNNCVGDEGTAISGYWPNWGFQDIKCLNNTEKKLPEYMQLDQGKWLYDDAESCCENYYRK